MSVAPIAVHRNPHPVVLLDHQSLITDVAKRCLIELALSLAIGAVSFFFTANLIQGTLLFVAIAVQTACNISLRYAAGLAAFDKTKEGEQVISASQYLCPTTFGYLTAFNAQILIHELGHAILAKLMFQNACPTITLTPCTGGVTWFNATHLTSLGEKIGRNRALFFTTLLGPTATLFVSGIAMAVGIAVQKKFPELGAYLIGVGRGDFYAHSVYAAMAMTSSPPSTAQDFVRLRTYGIHPLVSAVTILAIPVFISWALEKDETVQKPSKTNLPK